jgi:dihydrodipicolinate reductase
MNHIKISVAGADGRMGSTIIREAFKKGTIEVVGAITAENSLNKGKKLGDLNLEPRELFIVGPNNLKKAVDPADIYVTFTTPMAELNNIPKVVELNKKVVMGTTGFSPEEYKLVIDMLAKAPSFVSANFSIGINVIHNLLESMKGIPKQYDFTIIETHHTGKIDAPSGTANALASTIQRVIGNKKIVHGRKGRSKREIGELEVLSARAGGIPGIHEIMIAGENEMIRIEHTAFSRKVFAEGVLLAIEWISKQKKPGVYSMNEVFNEY